MSFESSRALGVGRIEGGGCTLNCDWGGDCNLACALAGDAIMLNAMIVAKHGKNARARCPGIAFCLVVPVITAGLGHYQAIWKPPRAPTSPLSKPTPTPAETEALSLTRADRAKVPAPWSSK